MPYIMPIHNIHDIYANFYLDDNVAVCSFPQQDALQLDPWFFFLQTIQSCLWIVDIFSVAKWVQRCKGHATGILFGRYLTPAVVLVSYHYLIDAVNQTGDISEAIIQIELIPLSIYSQHEWLSLRIIYIIRVPCTATPFGEHIRLRQN